MNRPIPEALEDLFLEFDNREFTIEQASLLCGVSIEMVEELLEEGFLKVNDEGLYHIVDIPDDIEFD